MEQEDSLAELMKWMAHEAKALSPVLRAQLEKFEALRRVASEKKDTGGATNAARQALQTLRNPLLQSTHVNKSRAVLAKGVQQTGVELTQSIEKAIKAYVLHAQMKIEQGLFQDDSHEETASREGRPIAERADVHRFVDELELRGVPLYALGRLRTYEYDLVAGLIADSVASDREADRNNWWNILLAHGVLEAFAGSMSADEAAMLDAAKYRRENPAAMECKKELEALVGRELGVTPAFAAVCWGIASGLREITTEDEDVIRHAGAKAQEGEVEFLLRLLGLGADERPKVEAFVSYIQRQFSWVQEPKDRQRINRILDALEQSVASYEAKSIAPSHWLEKLRSDMIQDGKLVAETLSDETAFYTLLLIALEKSRSFSRLETELVEQLRLRKESEVQDQIETWNRNGYDCYIDADGRPRFGQPPVEDEGRCTVFPAPHRPGLVEALEERSLRERELYARLDGVARPDDEPLDDEDEVDGTEDDPWAEEDLYAEVLDVEPADDDGPADVEPGYDLIPESDDDTPAADAAWPAPTQSRFEGLD